MESSKVVSVRHPNLGKWYIGSGPAAAVGVVGNGVTFESPSNQRFRLAHAKLRADLHPSYPGRQQRNPQILLVPLLSKQDGGCVVDQVALSLFGKKIKCCWQWKTATADEKRGSLDGVTLQESEQ
jgi:hypothetical protein